jgi:hypothetical protein
MPSTRTIRARNALLFSFGLIAANVAELSRTVDQTSLAPVSFLWGQGFIAKGLEFAGRHL